MQSVTLQVYNDIYYISLFSDNLVMLNLVRGAFELYCVTLTGVLISWLGHLYQSQQTMY